MNEWVWSNGGMILTGENWSTGRKTLYTVGGRWMNEYGAKVEWYWQGKTEMHIKKTSTGATLPTIHSPGTGLVLNRASAVSVWPLTAQAMVGPNSSTPVHVSRLCPNVTPHAQLLICKMPWRFNYGFWWYEQTDVVHSNTPVRLSVYMSMYLTRLRKLLRGRHGSHCRKTSAWRFYKTVWQVYSTSSVTLLVAKSNTK